MRSVPPILNLSTFFPVSLIVHDLTKAFMISDCPFLNSKSIPQAHPLVTLGNQIQIRGPPNQTGLGYHEYMEFMEKGTNDNVWQRETEWK